VFSTPANGVGFNYYMQNPQEIFNFWNGGFRGLGIYGGLVGGILAIAVYAWSKRLDVLMWIDFIAPNVLLAQAVGRLGNWVNQELYGPATDVAWAFHINPAFPCQDPPGRPLTVQPCGTGHLQPFNQESLDWYARSGFHPTFFYEALWNLLMFALLTLLYRRYGERMRKGDAILIYFIAYPLGRFWVELFRPDAWVVGAMATAQWIALGSVVVSSLLLVVRHWGWFWRKDRAGSMAYMQGRV
jgi:phosphatidylglycerol:prolipoprotein diacylglycerol transferase